MGEEKVCPHDPESICHKCKKKATCDGAQDPDTAKVTNCIDFEGD